MPYIKPIDAIQLADQPRAGDKAVYLGELGRAGFDIPAGFCILAEAYRDTIANTLNEKIAARIAAAEIDDPVDLEAATDDLRGWIENAALAPALVAEIQDALKTLSAKNFAVRASRVFEDVPNPAASGLQQAYLGIIGIDGVITALRQVWATPWNSRAIYYRHRKKIDIKNVTMAVIVQPMIEAEAAGVMFTANPLTGATNEIHIDSTWGLGQAIIAARWKPDHFVVAKSDLTINTRTIPNKTVMEIASPEGGVQSIGVADEKQDAASLSEEQVTALAALGKKIETQFNAPHDIEWCRVENQIWLLQTRLLKKR